MTEVSAWQRIAALGPDKTARITAALESSSAQLRGEPIAVVGMGCRLPGQTRGTAAFSQLLAEQRVPIGPVDPDRWFGDPSGVEGGFLEDPFVFDATFFGMTPREAESLDPQQRLVLEVAVEALEDTGRTLDHIRGSRTGVFLGIYHHDFEDALTGAPLPHAATGNAHSVAAGRLAYTFDLTGPALSFDTACSSSLVAVHQACRSLSARECDAAIVAGVNVMMSARTHSALASWGMLSPRARCSAFDAAADGFVRGEGVGAVVLKRLVDALDDRDPVLAVVRGSAVNQDGRSQGLTAPHGPSQEIVIRQALANAGVDAGSVDYVETHGTGTALGDPIEFEVLHHVYGLGQSTRPCVLGAVKANIGHLEAAAGIIGLIKAVLVLSADTIPANPGFEALNPQIQVGSTRLVVPAVPQAWAVDHQPRRAAVSSFGFGGTNAHLILEEGSPDVSWPRAHPRAWRHERLVPPAVGARSQAPGEWFLVPELRPAPAGAESEPKPLGPVCVLSPSGHRAEQVSRELRSRGVSASAGTLGDAGMTPGLVVLTRESELEPTAEQLHDEGMNLVRAALAAAAVPSTRVMLATVAGQPGVDQVDPAEAAWWGWARGLAVELDGAFAGAVDAPSVTELADGLLVHTGLSDDDLYSVFREGRRLVPRLERAPGLAVPGPSWSPATDRSYLVIGANGALGMAVAQHLADRGASNLTLTGRGLPGDGVAKLMKHLRASGVDVRWEQTDASSVLEMRTLLNNFGVDRPRLDGLFLASFAGGPAPLAELSRQAVDAMYAAKVDAAMIADRLTRDLDLSVFVLCSSTTSLLGSRHLAHYAAASAFLDGIAHRRRALDLPGLAINWGIWARRLGETDEFAQRYVQESGLRPMDDDLAVRALSSLLTGPAGPQVVVADADWGLVRDAYRTRGPFTILDDVVVPGDDLSPSGTAASLRGLLPSDRLAATVDHVRRLVADVMHLADPVRLDPGAGLFDLGVDSLMSLQIQRSLRRDFGLDLPPTVVFSHPTVERISRHLLDELGLGDDAGAVPVHAAEPQECEPVAVVGLACRFPGGATVDEFWETLRSGRDAVVEVPAQRWDAAAYAGTDHTTPGTIITPLGGFLTEWDPSRFDADFFGISPREAAAMDPQQRLILELAVEALSDAGLDRDGLADTRTGVFIGLTTHDYLVAGGRGGSIEDLDAYSTTGNAANFAAGRVSYHLGLNGPAMAVDTACSSSLTAVHLALGQLRGGDCDAALVGGVNLMLTPETSVSFTRWGMLSPSGHCRSFDEAADGFVRGEGGGIVLLKRLSDARRDQDRILAVIRGSACGQDGTSAGQVVPNGRAQADVIAAALRRSELGPDDIDFVEAHGAGTSVGDPIELEALASIFGDRTEPIVLGALKSVVGHMEAAAGIGSLIKTVLALSHREIPANLHFDTLTSRISEQASRVTVPRALMPWPDIGRPARAGVSSFGASGTNVHVVVEEAPSVPDTARAVWLYSGQGSQWEGMATDLLATDAAFAAAIADLAPLFERETGHALQPLLSGAGDIDDIALVQPVLFVMQIALSRSWAALGAQPAAVIGHSMGEVAAAVVAGALTVDDGMKVIARRSRLLSSIAGRGAMAVIEADEVAAQRLAGTRGDIDVAVIASPTQTVIAGATEAIQAVVTDFEQDGLFARPIKVDVASHSAQVDPLLPALKEALSDLEPREPLVSFLSTVSDAPSFDAQYWVENLRRPVRFMDAVRRAVATGATTFIEMAPHPLLGASVLDSADGHEVTFVPSLRRGDPSVRPSTRRLRPPVNWDRRRYWFDHSPSPSSEPVLPGSHALTPSGAHVFTARDLLSMASWLGGHRVDGVVVMPLAGWVSIIVEAIGGMLGRESPVEIDDLVLHDLMPVSDGTTVSTVLEPVDGECWRVRIGSWTGGRWQLHASALAREGQPGELGDPHPAPAEAEGQACAARMYTRLEGAGQEHLGVFRSVRAVQSVGRGDAIARLEVGGRVGSARSLRIFPPLLDGALQALAAAAPDDSPGFVLPRRIEHIRVVGRFGNDATAVATLAVGEGRGLGACSLTSADARLEVHGVELTALAEPDCVHAIPMFAPGWQTLPAAEPTASPGPSVALVALSGAETPAAVALGPALGGQRLSRIEDLAVVDEPGVVCVVVDAPRDATAADIQRAVGGLRDVAASLLSRGLRDTPRLYCLIHVEAAARPEPHQLVDAVRAVCRVLAYEHPDLRATVVVHDGCHTAVSDEVRARSAETDVALVGGGRWGARLMPLDPERRPLVVDVPVQLPLRAHVLDGEVALLEEEEIELGEHEVLIQVAAAGLNFSDVLKARGAYPFRPGEPRTIGGEVAGIVLATTPSSSLKVGDRVFGFADGSLATRVVAREEMLRVVPAGLGLQQAAALPVAGATAVHALLHLGRLRRGQTVLVHTASGGVGLAAISIAQRLGARVIATAGTEEKREFLRSLDVDEVADSRDLGFTGGLAAQGVDVILNTLGGQAMERSLALLNPGGTFVELSKEATFGHHNVDLGSLAPGAGICTVDLAHVLRHDLPAASALMDAVLAAVEGGDLRVPPITTHALDRLDDALAQFSSPEHRGKIIVVPPDRAALPAQPPAGRVVRPSGSYIVTGAFSGLGWATATWLASQRPGCLVLNGRRPPDEERAGVVEAWRAAGIRVEVVLGDVARSEVVHDLVTTATGPNQRIRGVAHSAGIVRDQTLLRIDEGSLAEVLAPKVTGTDALLRALDQEELDFCVLFSSAASLLGSPGQTAYSAANAAMDAVARQYRRPECPTLAINWGPWGETGLATRFSTLGYHVLSTPDGLAALERLIRSQSPQAGVFDVDKRQWFQSHPTVSDLPYFERLGAGPAADGPSGLPRFAGVEDQRAFVEEAVLEQVSLVLRRSRELIDVQAPFASLGLDSLMALELRNRLERAVGVKLPVTVIWSSPTICELVDSIVRLLSPHPEPEHVSTPEDEAAALSTEDQLLLDALGAALSEEGTPPR